MCNKCHNDCSCNKPVKPTKFEVGKLYIEPQSGDNYLCEYVGRAYAVLYRASCNHEIVAYSKWKEYVEPPKLYFKDLKPGEKFKWVKLRAVGKDAVCVKYDTTLGEGNGAISPSSIGLWAYLGEHTLGSANHSTDSPEREKELTEVTRVE